VGYMYSPENKVPIFDTFSVNCFRVFLLCISYGKIFSALIKNGDSEISASTGPITNVQHPNDPAGGERDKLSFTVFILIVLPRIISS